MAADAEVRASSASPLVELLSPRMVQGLSDPRSFERGERYAAEGRVVSLTQYRGEVLAVVRGTDDYQVQIRARGDQVLAYCSCPAWADGLFCKHCVAVALVFAGRSRERAAADDEPLLDDVERHLATLDPGQLAAILTSVAVDNVRLRERLYLSLARSRATGDDEITSAYRGVLDRIRAGAELVGYEAAGSVGPALAGVVDAIEDLLRQRPAFDSRSLLATATTTAEEELELVGDHQGYLQRVIYRLTEMRRR